MASESKAALVTGGSKRIGRALVETLASRGYDVLVHYHTSQGAAQELCSALSTKGSGGCRTICCDLADLDQVQNLIQQAIEIFPGLEILVNNASVFEPVSLRDTVLARFQNDMNVNLTAPFLLIRDFVNQVNNGLIVNLLDTRIFGTPDGAASYTISKGALWDVTRMAAREFGPGIRVNAIAPGLILAPAGEDQTYLDKKAQRLPLRSSGRPQNVAQALGYLLENEFVTGDCLMVDGGEYLAPG